MQIASGSTANQTRTLCPMVAINALRNSLDLVLIALTAMTFGLADGLAQEMVPCRLKAMLGLSLRLLGE